MYFPGCRTISIMFSHSANNYFAGDPFYGVVRFDTTITTVTVEAINCNGQRAKW